jgi:hypothetical protein
MESPSMLIDQQTEDYENGHITKSNVHVQHNCYQNSTAIQHRNRKIDPKIRVEKQKASNKQSNSEQKV